MEVAVLDNLARILQHWWNPIIYFSFLLGVIFFVGSLIYLGNNYGRDPEASKKAFGGIIVGVCLANLPGVLDMISMSMFQTQSATGLSYSVSGKNSAGSMIRFSVYLIKIVGLIGVVKGLSIMRSAVMGGGKGLGGVSVAYVLGGTACVNFVFFAKLMGSSLGGKLGSSITGILG